MSQALQTIVNFNFNTKLNPVKTYMHVRIWLIHISYQTKMLWWRCMVSDLYHVIWPIFLSREEKSSLWIDPRLLIWKVSQRKNDNDNCEWYCKWCHKWYCIAADFSSFIYSIKFNVKPKDDCMCCIKWARSNR